MLIVLEGLDGAGKSTQVKMMTEYLEAEGKKVKFLHFPRFDAPVYGDLIAKFLRGDFGNNGSVHPQLVALLFAEDRRDASVAIRKWIEEGYYVILDRYVYSNIAFQCAKLNKKDDVEALRSWILNLEYTTFGIPVPDLNLFLDVPISFVGRMLHNGRMGEDRNYLEGKKDIHEADIEFQKKVREVYLAQCGHDTNFIKVDCSDSFGEMLSPDLIFSKIRQLL